MVTLSSTHTRLRIRLIRLLGGSIAAANGFLCGHKHNGMYLQHQDCQRILPLQGKEPTVSESLQDTEPLFPEKLNIIYDSKCSVCQFEVDYLQDRMDKHFGDSASLIRFTDLEAEGGYNETDPANGGVTYAMGMKSFHAVKPNGEVLHGVPVFREAYEIVDQAWVWAATQLPIIGDLASMGYDLFARIRTPLTRGSPVDELIEKHYQEKSQQECIRCQGKYDENEEENVG